MTSLRGGRGTTTRSWASHRQHRNLALARPSVRAPSTPQRQNPQFHTRQIAKEGRVLLLVRRIVEHHEEPAARGADRLDDRREEQQEERKEGLHRGGRGRQLTWRAIN